MSGKDVFLIAGCRTPIGNFQGQYDKIPASQLGGIAIEEAIKRAHLTPEDVEQVIMGQVLTAGQGQNPARQAAVGAKVPYSVPAFTVNMLCGSGLKSVCLAYQAIKNEDCGIVVAGGQENMSLAPHSSCIRSTKIGAVNFTDTLLTDGLTDAFNQIHMGNTAELLAQEYNISREAQDLYAQESQSKTGKALSAGHFKKELVSVPAKNGKYTIETDEYPRPETTLEDLSKLRTVFKQNGTVTAGNASGINDGAAALVLCSEKQISLKNLQPMAKIIAISEVGIDPLRMGLGPIGAIQTVLKKAQWNIEEVDLFELNEAFAVQSIIVVEKLKLDKTKVNVSGGALALGHPIGASGARILITLIHNLERLGKRKGIASLCIGGGMGIAMAIERCIF